MVVQVAFLIKNNKLLFLKKIRIYELFNQLAFHYYWGMLSFKNLSSYSNIRMLKLTTIALAYFVFFSVICSTVNAEGARCSSGTQAYSNLEYIHPRVLNSLTIDALSTHPGPSASPGTATAILPTPEQEPSR